MMISSMSDALRVATLPVDDDFIVYSEIGETFDTSVTLNIKGELLCDSRPLLS